MYEELVKRLRIDQRLAEFSAEDVAKMPNTIFGEAADAIEEMQKLTDAQLGIIKQQQAYLTKQRWIPVTERLPDDGVKVICISRNGRVSDCDCLKSYVTKFGNYDMTTHWMPLEPPQKEERRPTHDSL